MAGFVKLTSRQIENKLDFIKDYTHSENPATGAKLDSNANVTTKNLTSMSCELNKDVNIQVNRKILYNKISKLFDVDTADEYIRQLEDHEIYTHDETSLMPYTYGAREVVCVEIDGKKKLVSFERLYDLADCEEVVLDEEKGVFGKYPTNMEIYDRNGKTKITRLVKKVRHRDLVRVKTAFNHDIIVTDNHPMIVSDNISDTVSASESKDKVQLRVKPNITFGDLTEVSTEEVIKSCGLSILSSTEDCIIYQEDFNCKVGVAPKTIKLDRDLGYCVGFFIGDGNFEESQKAINFTQKTKDVLLRMTNTLGAKFYAPSTIRLGDKYTSRCCDSLVYSFFKNWLHIGHLAQNKTIPENIFEINREFAIGVIEGLIDSDGTISKDTGMCSIRISSRAAVCQVSFVLDALGIPSSFIVQACPFSQNKVVQQKYMLFGVSFRDNNKIFDCEKSSRFAVKESSLMSKLDGWLTVTNVDKIDNDKFLEQNEYIYDITTESNTFVCNGLWVHNCVAISMYPFLTSGMKPLGGESLAPKHLQSFCGSFVNLIYAIACQFAGACLHGSQKIVVTEHGTTRILPIKELVSRFNLDRSFESDGSEWEYADVSGFGLFVAEDGKNVPINKVYRRKYNGDIYNITTKTGLSIKCSKDHKFKHLYRARTFETKAENLQVGDTLFVDKDYSYLVDKNSTDYVTGQVIGILCGDGSIGDKNVKVAVNPNQTFIMDFLDEALERIGMKNKGTRTFDDRGNGCWSYYIGSTNVSNQIKDMLLPGKTGTYDKNVDLKDKSLDWCLGFLDGLLVTDGSYSKAHHISITMTNKGLIENVEYVLGLLNKNKSVTSFKPKRENSHELYKIGVPLSVLKYLSLTLKKPTFCSIANWESRESHIAPQDELYYIGPNASKTVKSNVVATNKKHRREDFVKCDVIASIETERNDDEYVYELETETHWYNAGGFITHNCATVEFITYFDYFARKDFGDNYLKTNKREITDCFQQVIYCLNQPAGARNYQSTFWNISLFDKNYFDSLFGNFYFPDFTQPSWKSVQKLQNFFMQWFNEERSRALLTFPVVTAAMLVDSEKPVDEQFARDRAKDLSEGNSFFVYESNSVDSLSSCCFSGDTKFLWKSSVAGVKCTTFKDFFEMKYSGNKDNFKVFHNGSWVDAKVIKLPNRKMFRVVTENNKELVMTDNHINVTLTGEKQTSELTINDYLMFNTETLHAIPELDEHLTYEQGFVVGAFLGDGSFGKEIKGSVYEMNFSQNAEKYPLLAKMLDKCAEQMGIENRHKLSAVYNNVYPVRMYSKELVAFIQRWTCWCRGTYAHNKKLNLNVLTQSEEFRRGILDGWYNTDGGNSNRCYTTSKELAECMEILITSLGMQSIINVSDRTNEPCVIRETEYTRNYPLYCVRWYQKANHRSNKSVKKSWVRKNNSLYFRIKSIEEVPYDGDVYCVECANAEEPYFTLPCGVITHNCRLRNELADNDFSYSLGAGGVKSGSINVITINMNRLIQNVSHSLMSEKEIDKETMLKEHREELNERIKEEVKNQVEKIQKYQVSYRSVMESYKAHKMLPVYDAGFIDLDKQFLTTGVNGLVEACEYLGFEISDNKEYKDFVSGVLKVIYDTDKAGKAKYGYKFNTEFTPCENLGVKNAKWDKKVGLEVPRDCYNSYFYKVEDESLNEIDKFRLHGGDMIRYLDGGSALHLNLREYPDAEQYYQMMCIAAREGCNYWTTNIMTTICESCGYIDKHTLEECPKCGSKSVSHATRIIGYLKKISNFGKDRQLEAARRFYH